MVQWRYSIVIIIAERLSARHLILLHSQIAFECMYVYMSVMNVEPCM